MDGNFAIALAASLLAGLVTTSGILAVRGFKGWIQRNTTHFACFASGVLIAVSFLHIIPASLAMTPQAPAWLLAGYVSMLVLNRFLTGYVCDKPQTAGYAFGLVALFGIGFHSLLDGVVYSVSFNVSTFTGGLVALGMVLHEFPEGIVTYALLVRSGYREGRAFLLAFIAAAATTPIGTVASYPLISKLDLTVLDSLLSLSAGALIYVGATHLLPRMEREPRRFGLLSFFAGIMVALGIVFSKT